MSAVAIFTQKNFNTKNLSGSSKVYFTDNKSKGFFLKAMAKLVAHSIKKNNLENSLNFVMCRCTSLNGNPTFFLEDAEFATNSVKTYISNIAVKKTKEIAISMAFLLICKSAKGQYFDLPEFLRLTNISAPEESLKLSLAKSIEEDNYALAKQKKLANI